MMMGVRIVTCVVTLGLCGAALAQPPRTAVACTGDAIQDFKSFNLPSKTISQTRLYVIDETEKSIALMTDGELVPLCDKARPACHADFSPAGIKIDFREGEDAVKLVFSRGAKTLGEQSENATLLTTFEGHCQPAAVPAK
jgi:hypothetical protein